MELFKAALAFHRAGDLASAEAAYREVLAAAPDHDIAWGNLGIVLGRRDDPDAEAALRRAVDLAPGNAVHHFNLGNAYRRLARLPEARDAYARARAIDPDLRDLALNDGITRLALGDFAGGWPLYDHRPDRKNAAAHALGFPEWAGEPLEGKRLFLWREQGYGDQILAARFVPRLRAARVTLVCLPALTRLFSGLPAQVIPDGPSVRVSPHDYWCLPMSLPRWCPGPLWDGPYLSGRGPAAGRFGVAWRGNALPDPGRSLPDDLARRLLTLPGAVSLDPEDTGAADFQDTADLIAGLDFVVSIDTSVAHLAGAMGKPLWLLLQARATDWRWMQPWYPDTRIFRQASDGDWESAVAAVEAAL